METAKLSLRGVVDGASAEELQGVLLALEGRVVDLGEYENIRHGRRYNYCCSVWYTDSLCYTCVCSRTVVVESPVRPVCKKRTSY